MQHPYKSSFIAFLALSMVAAGPWPVLAQGEPSPVKAELPADSTLPPGVEKKMPPLNDLPLLPLPEFARTGSGLQLGQPAPVKELRALSSLAATSIEISARQVGSTLKGLAAFRLSVKNNTDRPLSFNGNQTTVTLNETTLPAAPMSDVSDRIQESDNPRGYVERSVENTLTAALTIGAVQTVEGERIRRGPIANRYGFDNANRSRRLERFGQRILWPGDSSEGTVYFKTNLSLAGALVQVPVFDFYDRKDSTVVPATVK